MNPQSPSKLPPIPIDELVEIASSADEERHTVWFKSMQITSPTSGKKKEGPRIVIPGSVAGSSLDRVVNLYKALAVLVQ